MRIDYGPGYRMYFTERQGRFIVLLAGGDKRSQQRDIRKAIELAKDICGLMIAKVKSKTTRWDSTDYLKTDRDIIEYLDAVLEDGDPALIAHALGVISRSKGMGKIASKAGLGRESLYKALSSEGNPELATFLKVIKALGLKLHVAA